MEMDNLLIHTGCCLERVLVSCYGKPQAFWLMLIKRVPCEGYSAALLWEVRECCAFQDFQAVCALSLQAGRTVGSPATCGHWGWCCSPCSMASSPSTTAYLRSSSAKSRLPSTPSLSEYSLPFLPGHGGLAGLAGAGGAPLSTQRVTAVLTAGCVQQTPKKQEQGWDSL